MAKTFTFTSPEGKKYSVSGPDDATQEQAWQILQGQLGAAAPAAEEPSTLSEVGRQLGLTVRHAITGITALPAIAGNAANSLINYATGKVNQVAGTNIPQLDMPSDIIQRTATAAGLPEPKNATERVVGDATSALAGVGATAKVGQALASTGNEVAQSVGQLLQQGLGTQATSAVTGAGASGITRENGGGAAAQAAAGALGSMVPVLVPASVSELARRGIRGGEAGRQQMVHRMADFEAAGVQPTLGQATGARPMQAVESALAKTPGGAGRIAEFAQKQADEMQVVVDKATAALAPEGADPTLAGEAIARGIGTFKRTFKNAQGALYDNLEQTLPKGTLTPIDNAKRAFAEMNTDIEGAKELSRFFQNGSLKDLEAAMLADAKAATHQPGSNSAMPLAPRPEAIPLEAMKKLRTLVGEKVAEGGLADEVKRSHWRRIYGALTDDLGEAAQAAGPQAEAAWQRVNQFTKDHMVKLEQLSSVINKDAPEKVFNAALSGTAEGGTVVRRVMSALPEAERNVVAGAVLQKLGRATAGQQNAMGDAFSAETFITNFAKLSPASRDAIFGAGEAGARKVIDSLAKLAEARREGGRVFANPSGTASATLQVGVPSAIASALATGNPGKAAFAAAVPLGANAAARLVTSKSLLKFGAGKTQIQEGAPASAAAVPMRLYSAADLPPEKRQVGQQYQLPQGRFIWKGNGWVPAP